MTSECACGSGPGRAHSACRSHTPAFLHVYSCFLLQNRGQAVLSVLFTSIGSQIVPLLLHTIFELNLGTKLRYYYHSKTFIPLQYH